MKTWNPWVRYFGPLVLVAVVTVIVAGCLPFPDRAPRWVSPSTPAGAPLPESAGR